MRALPRLGTDQVRRARARDLLCVGFRSPHQQTRRRIGRRAKREAVDVRGARWRRRRPRCDIEFRIVYVTAVPPACQGHAGHRWTARLVFVYIKIPAEVTADGSADSCLLELRATAEHIAAAKHVHDEFLFTRLEGVMDG